MVRLTRIHLPSLYILLSLYRPRGDTPGNFIHCTADKRCSNSLIIHEEKQRQSLPWRRFGCVILIIIKFGELLLWIIHILRRYINLWKECFIRYPNTSKLVKKKTRLRLVFSTHFSVTEYLMKHPSLCLTYFINCTKTDQLICTEKTTLPAEEVYWGELSSM